MDFRNMNMDRDSTMKVIDVRIHRYHTQMMLVSVPQRIKNQYIRN